MKKINLLKKYLLKTYSDTFFPIFMTLFIITSIIYLVRISTLTSIMQINFLELLELYSYVIPTILFYTFPIASFISLSLSLSKLSSEYELIVITSFGLNPLSLIRIFLPILSLTTIFLLFNSLVLIPKADSKYNSFKENKKVEAQFNIKASQYGQQFGSWLIYVDEENEGRFKDIVMFQKDNLSDTFIISKHAKLINRSSSLSLNLRDGKAFKINDKINQIDYKRMVLYSNLKKTTNIENFDDLVLYWQESAKNNKKRYKLTFSILLSIFPLMSILFVISFGYFNPRYNKNNTSTYSIILTILYVILSQKLSKSIGFNALLMLPFTWMSLSIIYYRLTTKQYY